MAYGRPSSASLAGEWKPHAVGRRRGRRLHTNWGLFCPVQCGKTGRQITKARKDESTKEETGERSVNVLEGDDRTFHRCASAWRRTRRGGRWGEPRLPRRRGAAP